MGSTLNQPVRFEFRATNPMEPGNQVRFSDPAQFQGRAEESSFGEAFVVSLPYIRAGLISRRFIGCEQPQR
jgi:hypothetical protein